jgi:hypothetical protein
MSGAEDHDPSADLDRRIELTERLLAIALVGMSEREEAGRDAHLLARWAGN